jgi:hypothetical protein
LNWNIGEENTQTPEQQRAEIAYLAGLDPYQHHRVIHTYPNEQDKVYTKLAGDQSLLTGVSLQNGWSQVHQRTLKWIAESDNAGRPWVVANDEQNPAGTGVPADPGYEGFDGLAKAKKGGEGYTLHDVRKCTLWGNLMAGGAGVEYYFGYSLPQNDLLCQDYRSRDQSWNFARIALDFFQANKIPFWDMKSADALVGNTTDNNSTFCFAKPDEIYLVYLPLGGTSDLDLSAAKGTFTVKWFNPRAGGELMKGSVNSVKAGGSVALGNPPADATEDWLVVIAGEAQTCGNKLIYTLALCNGGCHHMQGCQRPPCPEQPPSVPY